MSNRPKTKSKLPETFSKWNLYCVKTIKNDVGTRKDDYSLAKTMLERSVGTVNKGTIQNCYNCLEMITDL